MRSSMDRPMSLGGFGDSMYVTPLASSSTSLLMHALGVRTDPTLTIEEAAIVAARVG